MKKLSLDYNLIKKLYLNKKLSSREIAKQFNVSQQTIRRILKMVNVKIRNNSEAKLKGKIKPTKKEIYDLYWKQGFSTVALGNKYRVHNKTIARWMKNYGIKIRPLYKGASKLRLISDEKIVSLYKKYGNYLKVAEDLGGRPENVRNILNKYIDLKTYEDFVIKVNLSPSKELAYIIGVMLGDGSLSNNSVNFVSVDLIFAESFYNTLKNIGFNSGISKMPLKKNRKQTYHVWGSSKQFADWYKKLSLNDIYNFVSQKKEIELEFVRGFYESEGCHDRNNVLSMSNSDKELLEIISKILMKYNISLNLNGPYKDKRHSHWKPMLKLTTSVKSKIFHFFCNIYSLIKFRKDYFEEIALNLIRKITEEYKKRLNFNEKVIYKLVSKLEMNHLLNNYSPIFEKNKVKRKIPFASSNNPFILYICLDYLRELTQLSIVQEREKFIEGCIIHEIEHGKLNDSFENKKEEEHFINQKQMKEFPEHRIIMEKILYIK